MGIDELPQSMRTATTSGSPPGVHSTCVGRKVMKPSVRRREGVSRLVQARVHKSNMEHAVLGGQIDTAACLCCHRCACCAFCPVMMTMFCHVLSSSASFCDSSLPCRALALTNGHATSCGYRDCHPFCLFVDRRRCDHSDENAITYLTKRASRSRWRWGVTDCRVVPLWLHTLPVGSA